MKISNVVQEEMLLDIAKVEKKTKHNRVKRALENKKINLVDINRIRDAELHINSVHKDIVANSDTFFALCSKEESKWNQWMVTNKDIEGKLSNIVDLPNVYVSLNAFSTVRRLIINLYSLNCFWVDLDYYNIEKYRNKAATEMIEIMRKNDMFQDLEPSIFIDSGKGIYIIYLIENANAKACLDIWRTIENTLTERFESYGADPKSSEPAHVLRLAGSINSKTGRVAKIIYNSKKKFRYEQEQEALRRYSIRQISEILLPQLPYTKQQWTSIKASSKKKKQNEHKTVSMFNLYNLNWARLQDLGALMEYRKGHFPQSRELACFLYRYWSCCFNKDVEKALYEVLEFNRLFVDPLAEKEVIEATKSAEIYYERWEKALDEYLKMSKDERPGIVKFFRYKGCCIYSNKRLIKDLAILEHEMEEAPLRTIINTKVKNKRNKDKRNEWTKAYQKKKYRDENGLTSRDKAKLENISAIIGFMNKGLKQKEMAEKLGITKSLVSIYVKEIKEKDVLNKQEKSIDNDSINIVNEKLRRVDTSDIEAIIV